MPMTLDEIVKLKQEIRKQSENEVARLELALANAKWKLQSDEEDEAAAIEAALAASKPTEAA